MRRFRFFIWLGVIAIWIAAIVGLSHVVSAHMADPDGHTIAVVGYTTALVALASLMAHSWIAVRNSRKQHTMNVLLQTRIDPQFWERAGKIQRQFPGNANITPKALEKKENKEIRADVVWILNFYEFIATGIRHGDLDERLMRDCICTQFCAFCARVDQVIQAERHEDQFGNASVARNRVLRSVRWLQRRWQRKINHPQIPFWLPMWWPTPDSN